MFKKRVFILLFLCLCFMLVSCDKHENHSILESNVQNKTTSQEENVVQEKELKLNFYEKDMYEASSLDLYVELNINRNQYEIRILDANQNYILFTMDSKRNDKELSEGILSKTNAIYVYSIEHHNVKLLDEFEAFYIIQGYLMNETYIALGIQLDETDTHYAVVYREKEGLKELHRGENSWYFSMWPTLIKLETEMLLLEPKIDVGTHNDYGKEVHLYKLLNSEFKKIDFELPDEFLLLSTETKSNQNYFVTFWENTKEEKAYFIVVDKDGRYKQLPLPNKYRLIKFIVSNHTLIAIVQVGNERSYQLLVYDFMDGELYSNRFSYVSQMLSLSSNGKVIMKSEDNRIYMMEFKDKEMKIERINVKGMEEAILHRKILFTEAQNNVILTIYDDLKQFVIVKLDN